MTIEVFKTNVSDAVIAQEVLAIIGENFAGYQANFDLNDCDNILRVVNVHGEIQALAVIEMLNNGKALLKCRMSVVRLPGNNLKKV